MMRNSRGSAVDSGNCAACKAEITGSKSVCYHCNKNNSAKKYVVCSKCYVNSTPCENCRVTAIVEEPDEASIHNDTSWTTTKNQNKKQNKKTKYIRHRIDGVQQKDAKGSIEYWLEEKQQNATSI